MAKPTMVSGAYKNVCKKPTTSTSTQRSTERSFKKVEFTCNAKFTATSGLRQNLLVEGISERASNLITNNRRTSSIKHYKWDWKKWCGWCSEWEISLIRSNINHILDFLTGLFKKELVLYHWDSQVCNIFVSWPNWEHSSRQSPKSIFPHVRYIQ